LSDLNEGTDEAQAKDIATQTKPCKTHGEIQKDKIIAVLKQESKDNLQQALQMKNRKNQEIDELTRQLMDCSKEMA